MSRFKQLFIILILSIIFIVNLDAQLAETPWPTFGHDSRHTAQSTFSGPESPILLWKFNTELGITSSPVIGESSIIYIGSWDGYLYAINPDGSLKWRFYTDDKINSTPSIGIDRTIYIDSRDGYLYAVNPDGTLKWKFFFGTYYYLLFPTPAIGEDGTIYVCSDTLYAINPAGTLKWKYIDEMDTDPGVQGSPAIGTDGTIYINRNQYIHAIDPEGNLVWKYYLGFYSFSAIAVGLDGSVYTSSDSFELVAVGSDGRGKWRFQAESPFVLSPVIGADGTIYFASEDSYLYAVDSDNGTLKWKFKTGSLIRSSPSIDADGLLYINSWDKHLYAVNSDGSLKWKFKTCIGIVSSPAIGADGTLYFGTVDGHVYAIGDATKNPRVDIYSNDSSFWAGETVQINVKVDNTTRGPIDMYACIELDNRLYWFPAWSTTPQPNEIESGTWDEEIISFMVGRFHWPGTYIFYAAITEHDNTNIFDFDSVKITIE